MRHMPSKLRGSTSSPHFHSSFFIKKNTNRKIPSKKEKLGPPQNQGKTHPQQETNSPNKHTRL